MNVAIIEDHKLLADALKNALSGRADINEIQIFLSGEAFLNKNNAWRPQVIISDILMPGKNGVDLIRDYKAMGDNNLKIIIMSSISNTKTVKEAMKQGAHGYLNKEEPLEELINAIDAVTAGEQYISKSIRNKMISNMLNDSDQITFHLSPREKEVLHYVCSGLIIKEIAARLDLSVNTVQGYHKNIMHKFNAKRTTDLIIIAIQNGFYNPEIRNIL